MTHSAHRLWCGLQTFLSPPSKFGAPVSLPDHGHPCLTFNQKLVSPDKQCLLASSKEPCALTCLFLSTSLRHPCLCRQGSWGIRGLFTSDSLHLPPKFVSGRSNHLDRALLKKTALFPDPGVMPWGWQRPEACRALWSPSPGYPAGPGRASSCCMWARLPCKYLKQREQLGELSFQGSNLTEIRSEKIWMNKQHRKRDVRQAWWTEGTRHVENECLLICSHLLFQGPPSKPDIYPNPQPHTEYWLEPRHNLVGLRTFTPFL